MKKISSNTLNMFIKAGALLEGHFVLSSGLHSEKYMQCALLLSRPDYAAKLCKELAKKFKGKKVDVVIGPALGGVIVAYELARQLGARALFTERKEGQMQLRRNFFIKPGERVVVAEDVVTTGKSTNEVIEVIKPYQPKIVAVASLVDRSSQANPFGDIKFISLQKVDIKTYPPEDCPLCKRGIPAAKPGSRSTK